MSKNLIKIIISDNGIGIRKDYILETSETLGLQLVNTLIKQLDGTIEMKVDGGTTFVLQFTEHRGVNN